MHVECLEIPAVKKLVPRRFADVRGYFVETYSQRALADRGIDEAFVQDNHAYSRHRGTIRGLHFQVPPQAQAKIVRVVRGSIYDVAVDLRHGSPTYGRYVTAVLSAENGEQLYIPIGFAHGLCTLEDETEVLYKASAFYAPTLEGCIRWDDPGIGIPWPLEGGPVIVSERDAGAPPMAHFDSPFRYL